MSQLRRQLSLLSHGARVHPDPFPGVLPHVGQHLNDSVFIEDAYRSGHVHLTET